MKGIRMYYIVKYTGKFGFVKPWTAVRDGETYSQQFLSPSTLEGIEKKLFPETLSLNGQISKIVRYRLTCAAINIQQEQTQTRGFNGKRKIRDLSILKRGVMIDPTLYLAFNSKSDAEQASYQHICLCRNEDILLPDPLVEEMDEASFNSLKGFELRFGRSERSFLVGYNRFNGQPMYGWLEIDGKSIL